MTYHSMDETSTRVISDQESLLFPCSRAQARFWALDQMSPGNPSLNVAVRWRLRGRVDSAALQRAFELLIERHEILRTRYEDVDGTPNQIVLPHASFQLATIDLSLRSRADIEGAVESISAAEADAAFNLTRLPVLRATLLTVKSEEHFLLVTVHHIASDGWSMGIMARDLLEFYDATRHGRPPRLPELSIQYGDFAEWHNQAIEADPMTSAHTYWSQQLAGFKLFKMPTDHPRSANPSKGFILGRQLSRSLTDGMSALGAHQGCTFFVVGLSALLAMLYGATGSGDITLGTQIAGRDRVEVEDLIGPFIKTVPLRFSVSDNLTFSDLLAHVGQTVQDSLTYQDVPIETLIQIARPPRDPTHHPLFTCNVICQRTFIREDVRADIALIDMPSVSAGALYDLNFFFVERPDGWRMSCEFDTGLFERETVEAWLSTLHELLERFVADPHQALGQTNRADHALNLIEPAVADPVEVDDGGMNEKAEHMARLWAEVLKLPEVRRTDNFFELGGHSLLALRLLARVEKTFGRKIGIDKLFAYPTVDALTRTLVMPEPRKPDHDGIVALQPSGTAVPIFAIHDSYIFQELAERLGPNQPFFAVTMPVGLQAGDDIDYPEIASHYLDALRRVRPHGPYILLGLCFAARLAFEMSRQLTERGEHVDLLVAIDAWAPGYLQRQPKLRAWIASLSYRLQRFGFNLAALWQGGSNRTMVLERGRLLASRRLNGRAALHLTEDEEEFRRITWIDTAGRKHVAQPLPVPVLAFHNDGQPRGRFLDASLGWTALARGPLKVCSVAGKHGDILRGPGAAMIARVILDERAAAQAG